MQPPTLSTPTETLLRAVVEASRHLAAEAELGKAMQSALDTLGKFTGLDRVYIVRYDHDQQAGFMVAEYNAEGVANVTTTLGAGPYTYLDYEEVWRPLLAGQTYSSCTGDKTGENAALNQHLGTKSDLFVPIFVSGAFWGAIGFDDCTTARIYAPAEIAVLCGAAAALAAAIGRDSAEVARLASERARAQDTHDLNHMLEGVVAASRALLDEPDFQIGIQRWLASLAIAVDADRAVLGNFAENGDASSVAFTQVDYTKPGVKNIVAEPIPASADFVLWGERLHRGETIWAHRSELVDPVSVRYFEESDCFTSLVMPVIVDRTTVGWVCFDWSARREWRSAYGTLRTAADGAAAAFKHDETVRTTLAEREARAAELATVNRELELRSRLLDAAARSSALLSASEDFNVAVIKALGVVAEVAEFDRARIVEYVDEHGNPDPRYFKVTFEWRQGEKPGLTGVECYSGTHDEMPIFAEQILQRDSIVDYRLDELPDLATSPMQRGMDALYYLAGSIWIDNRPWGAFSCDDYATNRRRTDEEKGVIDSRSHQALRNRIRWLLPVMCVVVAAYFTWRDGLSLTAPIIFGGFAITWWIFYPRRFDARIRAYAKKQMAESSFSKSLGAYELQLLDEHLHSMGPLGSSTYSWSGVDRVTLCPDYLFIFLSGALGYPIRIVEIGREVAQSAYDFAQERINLHNNDRNA